MTKPVSIPWPSVALERWTKRLALGWAGAALSAYVWLLAAGWPWLSTLTLGAFTLAALLTAIDRRAVGAVLALAYVFPALIGFFHGAYHPDYDVLWMAALLGAIAPDGLTSSWHLPERWRGPLVCWVLVVAVSMTIVFGRELDFYPRLLFEAGPQRFSVRWVIHVGLTLMIGILWFDWLFGAAFDFHAAVATPLMVSCLGLAGVAMYQLFVDFTFLNVNVFGSTGRASATMFDANVAGTIAALWTGGAVLWASALRRGRRLPALAGAVMAAWVALWASGSRTAFVCGLVASAFAVATLVKRPAETGSRSSWIPAAGLGVLVVAVLVVLAGTNASIQGPLRRFGMFFEDVSLQSSSAVLFELWDRNRYGSATAAMIEEFPFFGVGIGSVHFLVGAYAGYPPLESDNAQNWYRHQLAELGLIGSLAWIAWFAVFALFVFRRRASIPSTAWAARGMLVGLALVSFVGVPAQSVAISITFWTMAYWFTDIVGRPAPWPLTWRTWATVSVIVLAFTIGTAYSAVTSLRPPMRAQRAGAPFSYGFYQPEPDGDGGEFRWARQRASIVLDAPHPLMTITVRVNHRDIASVPVDVKLWQDGQLVLDTTLNDDAPVTRSVRVSPTRGRVVLDSWVSRVVRPADLGAPDSRELGLMVNWSFSPALPRAGPQ
jgi:hypothetical protein